MCGQIDRRFPFCPPSKRTLLPKVLQIIWVSCYSYSYSIQSTASQTKKGRTDYPISDPKINANADQRTPQIDL